MKKLFSLCLAVLASVSLWAVDPDLAVGTTAQTSSTFLGKYETEGITLSSDQSYSSGAVQLGNTPSGDNAYKANYFEVLAANNTIDSVSFLISGNGSNKSIQAPVFAWEDSATSNSADTYVLLEAVTVTANSYAAAKWFTYDLSNADVKCARIYRATKNISSADPAYTGSSTQLGSGNTIKIYGIKVWLKAAGPVVVYTATYKANNGTEEADIVDDAAKKVAACTFTAPEGKKFAGWNTAADGSGDDYEVGAALAADVTLYAQWAKVCYEVIFDFAEGIGSAAKTADDATVNEGVSLVLSNTSGTITITPAEGFQFKNGDIIEMAGSIGNTSKNWGVKIGSQTLQVPGTNCELTGVLSLASDAATIDIARADGTTTTITSLVIKRETVCKEIVSTVETLEAVTVDDVEIGAEDLATLLADHSIALEDSYVDAPEVIFTKHIVITYDDESQKVSDEEIKVTAEEVAGVWSASAIINEVTYTVTAVKAASFTVTYKYGTETLGTENVAAGEAPAEYAQYETLVMATFGGWFYNAALTEAADMTAAITADKTFYAKFTKTYISAAVDFENLILNESKSADFAALLTAAGYGFANLNALDSLDDTKTGRNEPYLGLKIKKSGGYIEGWVKAGDYLVLKMGTVSANMSFTVNKETNTVTPATLAEPQFLFFSDDEDTYIKLATTTDATVVLKQLAYNDDLAEVVLPWKVTFEDGIGTSAAASLSGASIVLPEVNDIPEGFIFDGWFTEAAGGEKVGVAGEAYIPTANVTLYAQYSEEEPAGCDWASLAWLGSTDPQYSNQFKVCVSSTDDPRVVNIQQGFGEEIGIYCEGFANADFQSISVPEGKYSVQGAGIIFHISYFKAKETEVEVVCGGGGHYVYTFTVYNDKGTATAIDNTDVEAKAVKALRNGQLFIEMNGVVYNAQGQIVR